MVTGGRPLNGSVKIPAAKNSVLPLFAASLLCTGEVRLQAVPRLADVEHCMALLRGGAALVLAGLTARGTTVITHPAHIDRGYAGFTEILAGLGAQIRRESAPGNRSAKKPL